LDQINYDIEKNNHQVVFHFDVGILEENDIVNFQYYFLIKQMYPLFDKNKKFSLFINQLKSYESKSLIFKIGHFLSLETKKDSYCILSGTNWSTPLPYSQNPPSGVEMFKSFFPLLEINEQSYELLSMSIRELVSKLFSIETPTFLPDIDSPKIFRDKEQNESKSNNGQYDLDYLFYGNSKAVLNSIDKNYFSESDFFEMVRDLPFLTLMMLSASFRDSEIIRDRVQIDVYAAVDFTEGILQLLENIVQHSAQQKGYFCFRLHQLEIKNEKTGAFEKNKYLQKEYKDYFQYLKDTNSSLENNINNDKLSEQSETDYLEMFVVDAFPNSLKSEAAKKRKEINSPVVDVFKDNVLKRIRSGENYLGDFNLESNKVLLKDFFDSSKVLSKYEIHYSNISRHYGLKRFSNSVSAVKGFFLATSTYGFECTADGMFRGLGRNLTTKQQEKKPSLPGTKYQILLPINTQHFRKLEFVGIDTNQNRVAGFDSYVLDKIKFLDENYLLNDSGNNKNKRIDTESEKLSNLFEKNCRKKGDNEGDEDTFFCVIKVDENIRINRNFTPELIGKVILRTFAKIVDCENRFAIILEKCPKYFIPEFVRYIMIAYDRFNPKMRQIMENRQIYCIGEDPLDDFQIMGTDLIEMRRHMINRSTMRGAFPSFLLVLNFIMSSQDNSEENGESVSSTKGEESIELPFDLLIERNEKSLFELRTEKILTNQISEGKLGCQIGDSHAQIGSKVHIHNFYDAEILFQSTYFTTRFAALLAKDIYKKIKSHIEQGDSQGNNKYKLIGYGNYSELVVSQTQELLKGLHDKSFEFVLTNYLIVDQKSEWDDLPTFAVDEETNEKYFIIVPINSTLSTHNKLFSRLIESSQKGEAELLANYALVLVRDQVLHEATKITRQEKRFWEAKNKKTITTKLFANSPITYFIEVPGEWEDPLECPMCFPIDEKSKEKAIIETNITSIIPMLKLEKASMEEDETKLSEFDVATRVNQLAEVANYGHTIREDNHYLFYFPPGSVVDKYGDSVKKWLEEKKKGVRESDSHVYNFIVAPLGINNTSFVEMINEVIFDNSAQVLRFDIRNEYRSNFVIKYSYITELAENLDKTNKMWEVPSTINFYFIDDVIITGQTLERAKSLINSLFHRYYFGVTQNVFKGIFVLFNRLSKPSIENYIDKSKHYYFYSNFPITPIRNDANFCYLCNKEEDYIALSKRSCFKDIQAAWKLVSKKFEKTTSSELSSLDSEKQDASEKPQSVENLDSKKQNEEAQRNAIRSKLRVVYSAKIDKMIKEAKKIDSKLLLLNFFKEINFSKEKTNSKGALMIPVDQESKDALASFLKLLARPDFVYTYSTREALLQLLINMVDIFVDLTSQKVEVKVDNPYVGPSIIDKKDKVSLFEINKIKADIKWLKLLILESDINKVWLFDLLVEQLAELNSTRILRKDFLEYVKNQIDLGESGWFLRAENSDEMTALMLFRMAVSKITKLNRDESKSLWLEYLLVNGDEAQDKLNGGDEKFLKKIWGGDINLGLILYLENTKVIERALDNLIKPNRNANCLNDSRHYYLNNFNELLSINGYFYPNAESKREGNAQLSFFDKKPLKGVIENMIALRRYLKTQNGNNSSEKEENILEALEEIGELINGIASGLCTDILVVPPERPEKFDYRNYIVSHYAPENDKNDNEFEYGGEDFDESKYLNETFLITKNRIIINVLNTGDGKTEEHKANKENIFIAIHLPDDDTSKLTFGQGRQHAFTLRNVLLFRSGISTYIENQISARSIQSWSQALETSRRLENIKIVSHTSDSHTRGLLEKFIGETINLSDYLKLKDEVLLDYEIISKLKEKVLLDREVIFELKEKVLLDHAIILKILADTYVSLTYHEGIVHPEAVYSYVENNTSPWAADNSFSKIFDKELIEALAKIIKRINETIIKDGKRHVVWNLGGEDEIGNYFLTNPSQGFLLIIPIIENAIKNCPEGGTIIIDKEPVGGEAYPNNLYYLTVSNELEDKYNDKSYQDQLIKRLRDNVLYDVELRRTMELGDDQMKNDGISLFSVNLYCKRLLSYFDKNYTEKMALKIKIGDDKPSGPVQLVVKIPILYVEGGDCEKHNNH
jgi:hypothetical protein